MFSLISFEGPLRCWPLVWFLRPVSVWVAWPQGFVPRSWKGLVNGQSMILVFECYLWLNHAKSTNGFYSGKAFSELWRICRAPLPNSCCPQYPSTLHKLFASWTIQNLWNWPKTNVPPISLFFAVSEVIIPLCWKVEFLQGDVLNGSWHLGYAARTKGPAKRAREFLLPALIIKS